MQGAYHGSNLNRMAVFCRFIALKGFYTRRVVDDLAQIYREDRFLSLSKGLTCKFE